MKKIAFVAALIAVIVFGIVAYSFAATSDSQSVVVNASVNSKLLMTVDTTPITFAAVDPEAGLQSVAGPTVTISSNKTYGFSRTWTPNVSGAFSDTYSNAAGAAKTSGTPYNGNVQFTPSWDLEGPQTGTLQFSATQ